MVPLSHLVRVNTAANPRPPATPVPPYPRTPVPPYPRTPRTLPRISPRLFVIAAG